MFDFSEGEKVECICSKQLNLQCRFVLQDGCIVLVVWFLMCMNEQILEVRNLGFLVIVVVNLKGEGVEDGII